MQREELVKPGVSERDGILSGTVTHDRLMILPAKFWTAAKEFLEEAYGESVNVVLNRFARDVGNSYGELLKEHGVKPAEALEVMAEMAEVAGWGRVKCSGDTSGGSALVFEIANCAFCPVDRAARGGKCDFMAGVAEGLAKAIYDGEYSSDHVDASSTPELVCRLTIRKTNRTAGNWRTAVHFPWMLSKEQLI